MAAQLLDIGETVSGTTIMAKVLVSLSSKYVTFQTAWDSVDLARQTIDYLQERLIREEARLTEDSESSSAFSAFKTKSAGKSEESRAKKSFKKTRKPKDRADTECFKCKEKGYYARECKNKRREKDGNGSDRRETRECAFVVEQSRNKKDIVGNERGSEPPVNIIDKVLNACQQKI